MKSIGACLMVLLFLTGAAALAYSWWTRPVTSADRALGETQYERALAQYATMETRFDRVPFSKQLFTAEYNRLISNQLWLLYRLGRYDDTIEKAERAPEAANPHFWAGCAMFRELDPAQKPDEQQQWINRAQEEFRLAAEANPDDWDTKYNYELLTRLEKAITTKPKSITEKNLHLLRPQPFDPQNKPSKRVG
jgi:tetratricopeptide (TPR) repeat protein